MEFQADSLKFFDEVRAGKFQLIISELTIEELDPAPTHVQHLLKEFMTIAMAEISTEAEALQQAYLKARVVGPASENDALHVAIATLAEADIIVSWNFKHIVHYDKIAGYESINAMFGYRSPRIYSPKELVSA